MRRFFASLVVCTAAFVALAQTRSGAVWRAVTHLQPLVNSGTGITSPELLAYDQSNSRVFVAPAFGNVIYVLNGWFLDLNSVIRGVWRDQFKAMTYHSPSGQLFVSNGYGVTVFGPNAMRTNVTLPGTTSRPTRPVAGDVNVFVRTGDTLWAINIGTLAATSYASPTTPLAIDSGAVYLTDATATAPGQLYTIASESTPGLPTPIAGTTGLVPANVTSAVVFGVDPGYLAVVGDMTLRVFELPGGLDLYGAVDISGVGTNIRLSGDSNGALYAAGSNGVFEVDAASGTLTDIAIGTAGDVLAYDAGDGITEYFYTLPEANKVVSSTGYSAEPIAGASDLAINTSANVVYLAERRPFSAGRVASFDGANGDQFLSASNTACPTVSTAVLTTPLTLYGGCTDFNLHWFQGTSSGSINLPNGALDLAVNETLDRIYAVGQGGLSVINGITSPPAGQASLPGAEKVAVNPVTSEVYVTVPGPVGGTSTLAIFDATGSLVTTRTAAARFTGLTAHPNGNVYVVAQLETGSELYVYDPTTHDSTGTISLPAISQPVGIAIDSTTNTAYIPDAEPFTLVPAGETGYGVGHQMFVVDLSSGSVVHTIRLSGRPSAIALNPITGRVYVASDTSDSFDVYQIATANPGALTFNATVGTPVPDQSSDISTDREPGIPLLAGTNTPWVPWFISTEFQTPVPLPIGADPTGLAAGTYSGSIFLTDSGEHIAGLPIGLTLNVSANLSVSPSSLHFAGSGTQTVTAYGPAGSVVSGAPDVPWLAVTGGGAVPQILSVTASAAGLGGGTHNGSFRVTSPTAPSDTVVPVTITVDGPGFTVSQYEIGEFTQAQLNARYQITIYNSGTQPTVGTVTVTDTLPAGMTARAISGTGWTCTLATLSCTRSDVLAPSSISYVPYPPINLVVDIAPTAATVVSNQVTVSGGGSVNVTSSSTTNILPRPANMVVKILPADGQSGDSFSSSVALDASRLFVGAPAHMGLAGAVYVYSAATGWAQDAKLSPSATSSGMGTSIGVLPDAVVAGASRNPGVHVFARPGWTPGPAWSIGTGGPTGGDIYGSQDFKVAASGATVIVGALHENNEIGAAYVYVRDAGGSWTQQARLTAGDAAPGANFGISVAISGDTALIGASGDNAETGAAYAFVRSGTTWTQQQKLTAPGGVSGEQFGWSLAVQGDRALIGKNSLPGGAHVFTRTGTVWTEQTQLATVVPDSNFGASVALDGDVAVVGAPLEDNENGAVHVFRYGGTGWQGPVVLRPPEAGILFEGGDRFGTAVAVNGNRVAVAQEYEGGTGAAYVYELGGPDLTVTKTHSGDFYRGQTGAVYSIAVSNVGGQATSGIVAVTDSLPAGMTPASISGTGWTCQFSPLGCTRSDALAAGAAYPAITLTVNVSASANSGANAVTVWLTGDINSANNTDTDFTTVASGPPVQLSCPASTTTIGTFYNSSASVGSVSNVQWSLLGGSLPAGLTFSGGTISGTPAGPPGETFFSIRGSTGGSMADAECSITVVAPALRVTSGCPAATATVGVPFGPFAMTADGGLGPGTYSFTNADGMLPPGMFMRDNQVQGTPTNPGVFRFAIQATSGTQIAKSSMCSIAVSVTPLELQGACPGTVQSGGPVSIPLTASGGLAPYRWSIDGPSWLSVQGGTVSGTAPTAAGDHSFTVTVSDSANSPQARFSCSIRVAPPPLAVNGGCPASVQVRSPASTRYTIEGGVAPYRTTLSGPSWLSLAADGAGGTVAGTPGEVGTHRFTLTVTDQANTTATWSCDIVATSPPLSIAGACPAGLVRPGSISMPVTGAGGMGQYTWTVSGPAWLAVSGSGAQATVSGTPLRPGSVNFTVRLADDVKTPPASLACTVAVAPPVLPPLSVAFDPQRRPLTEPQPASVQFNGAVPVPLAGSVELTFIPDVPGVTDNLEVQFVNSQGTALGRSLGIQVSAGGNSSGTFLVRQGTVAGTIRLVLKSLTDGGVELLGEHVSADFVIARAAPVITSMTVENERADGFDVVIAGYSTTREIRTVQLNFVPKPEAQLQGSANASVDVSQLFAGFYARPAAQNNGSAFTGLRIPVNVGGNKAAIGAVEATLVNSVGSSQPSRVSR